MKWIALFAGMILIGVAGWRVGGVISSDAVSMAVGVMFGVLAGVPTALMVLAMSRRGTYEHPREEERMPGYNDVRYLSPPHVIVVADERRARRLEEHRIERRR